MIKYWVSANEWYNGLPNLLGFGVYLVVFIVGVMIFNAIGFSKYYDIIMMSVLYIVNGLSYYYYQESHK